MRVIRFGSAALAVVFALATCNDDADDVGVGAQCAGTDECPEDLACLAFKGGYCGLENCTADADCPELSACVAHTDGKNYCFRICTDKPECNANRDIENEANCSSSVEFVEQNQGSKACVPPSST